MEMNWEIYNFLAGIFLGTVTGTALGVWIWHAVCRRFGWYREEERTERPSCREIYA